MVGLAVHHLPVADQRETPHGHPWPFVSIILSGGYTELVRGDDGDTIRTWRAGSFHLFPTWLTHRVIAVEPEDMDTRRSSTELAFGHACHHHRP